MRYRGGCRLANGQFSEISESHEGRCIRTQRYTYEISKGQSGLWFEAFLYDNKYDPHQLNNGGRAPVGVNPCRIMEAITGLFTDYR